MSGATVDADTARSEASDGSITVIDVRRRDEYERGHVPGALSLPISDLLSDDGDERAGRLFGSLGVGDEDRVAVYDDTFGALASRVAWTLEHIGHRGGVSLLGVTYGGWKSDGLDVEAGAAPDRAAAAHSVAPRGDIAASAEYVEGAVGRGDAVLLDNRERLNYLEQHIPGAVSMPYRMLGAPGGRVLHSAGRLGRLFANRGVDGRKEVVTYCGSVGTLSGLAYYALREAGIGGRGGSGGGVRLYVRSFREWKGLQKPVERQEDANYWDLSAE